MSIYADVNTSIVAYRECGGVVSKFNTLDTPIILMINILNSENPLEAYKEAIKYYHPEYASDHLEGLSKWQKSVEEKGGDIKVKVEVRNDEP